MLAILASRLNRAAWSAVSSPPTSRSVTASVSTVQPLSFVRIRRTRCFNVFCDTARARATALTRAWSSAESLSATGVSSHTPAALRVTAVHVRQRCHVVVSCSPLASLLQERGVVTCLGPSVSPLCKHAQHAPGVDMGTAACGVRENQRWGGCPRCRDCEGPVVLTQRSGGGRRAEDVVVETVLEGFQLASGVSVTSRIT